MTVSPSPQTNAPAALAAPVRRACPLCESHDHELVARRGKDGSPLPTVICRGCGLVFTNPMPSAIELDDFYKRSYRSVYKGTFTPKLKHVFRSGRRTLARYERLAPYVPKGKRVLDVGSGGGEFLYLLRRLGYEVQGIEPNQGYGEFARNVLGLPVEVTTLGEMTPPTEPYDLITAHHVVEHLREPVEALAVFKEWLVPGGYVIIEVPNVEARYHAPHTRFHFAHLYNFAPEGLEQCGRLAGLNVVDSELVAGTSHVNVVFRNGGDDPDGGTPPPDSAVYTRVREGLRAHTPLAHAFSRHPYFRLVGNLVRPVLEKRAVASKHSATSVLDALFEPYAKLID